METGSGEDLELYTDSYEIYGGDMGTEFGVPAVRRLPARDVLPWMLSSLTEASEAACNCEDDWDVVVPGASKIPTLSFENCIRVPTLMHVITNASNDMLGRSGTLNSAVDGLSAISKMLSGKHTLDRLKTSCFSTLTGKAFHDDLATVKSQVYRKRLGFRGQLRRCGLQI